MHDIVLTNHNCTTYAHDVAQVLRSGLVDKRSRAVMIATTSPSSDHAEHTLVRTTHPLSMLEPILLA